MAKTKNNVNVSTEVLAVAQMAEDIQTAEELYADGMPYELERIENEIRFFQQSAGQSLIEMGKRLIRIKAHEGHGGFRKSLEQLELTPRSAQYAMTAARRFANTKTFSHLGTGKMIALSVLDDDEIQTLNEGGDIAGINLDDIDRMSVRELRENLRKERDKIKKEKEARNKDREIQEKTIAQKERKINELDQQLRYQQPPTKEQIALAELQKLNESYTFTLARINAGIREALGIVQQAEKTPGTDALQLSEWLNQFDVEMRAFNELSDAWLDEVDNASPITVGRIIEAGDVSELG